MHSVLVQVSDSPDIDKLAATMVKFIDGRKYGSQKQKQQQTYFMIVFRFCSAIVSGVFICLSAVCLSISLSVCLYIYILVS